MCKANYEFFGSMFGAIRQNFEQYNLSIIEGFSLYLCLMILFLIRVSNHRALLGSWNKESQCLAGVLLFLMNEGFIIK
jgi:hypothetical protein